MKQSFINIKTIYGTHDSSIRLLSGKEMSNLPSIDNAYLQVENGKIVAMGKMDTYLKTGTETDMKGQVVFPAYCDSHTHIVFAEPRESEFEMKIKGMTYEQIAAAGGGILNSALKLRNTSKESLFQSALLRLENMMKMGTGAIEIKSGYGLTIESEIKMLEVIRQLKEKVNIPVKATFLGAHAIPSEYKSNPEEYIKQIIFPCIERVSKEKLADYIDIFVEKNYFSIDQSHIILDYADRFGLKSKLHVNQLSNMGGVQLGVDRKAISVDHLEEMTQIEMDYLKQSKTIATILPSCSFFIKIPYAPAREMIDAGLPIALATDYNPGSTPSGNMNFVNSLACIYQKLVPNEAINASTLNGAYAMELEKIVGSISVGKQANFFTSSEIKSPASIPYSFGKPMIEKVYINGIEI